MLLSRLLTGIPLALAAIWFIVTRSSESIGIAMIIISLLAGWEWSGLSGFSQPVFKVLSAVVIGIAVYAVVTMADGYSKLISLSGVIWWLAVIVYLVNVKSIRPFDGYSIVAWLVSLPVLLPSMYAVVSTHQQFGGEWLLFGMSLVWIADVGAYFAGKRFGKHKLAPVLSPGKTREGFYGAVTATVIYCLVVCIFYFQLSTDEVIKMLFITLVINVFSVTGDLLESLLKRKSGVKDSGKILPGHGGVLDRIDSLTATMCLFLLGSIWIHSSRLQVL